MELLNLGKLTSSYPAIYALHGLTYFDIDYIPCNMYVNITSESITKAIPQGASLSETYYIRWNK